MPMYTSKDGRISPKNFSYGVSLVRNGWEAIFAGVAGIERDS